MYAFARLSSDRVERCFSQLTRCSRCGECIFGWGWAQIGISSRETDAIVPGRMKTDRSRNSTTIRDVLQALLASRGVLRIYVSEPEARRPRVIEGVLRSLLPGRDGRDRVIIAVQSASEHVEIRMLVDRIARVEKIDDDGRVDPKCSAGEIPEEAQAAVESARMARAAPGKPQHKTTKPARMTTTPSRAKSPASMPVRRETPRIDHSGPELTSRGRAVKPTAETVPDLRKPSRR